MANPKRELGTLDKPWAKQKASLRTRWLAQGTRELSSRVASRMGISNKEAYSLLRMIGLEMAQMAYEGWVFSMPNFCIFWTYVTTKQFRMNFKTKELTKTGGNVRLNCTENYVFKLKLKSINKGTENEIVSDERTE